MTAVSRRQWPGSTLMSLHARRRASDVNSVRPYTGAVATMNRSAGSRCSTSTLRLARATSMVGGASETGEIDIALRSQRSGPGLRTTRPRSQSSRVSHTLEGKVEAHASGEQVPFLPKRQVDPAREVSATRYVHQAVDPSTRTLPDPTAPRSERRGLHGSRRPPSSRRAILQPDPEAAVIPGQSARRIASPAPASASCLPGGEQRSRSP